MKNTMSENAHQRLNTILRSCGVALTGDELEKFSIFYDMLVRYNEELDLTRLIKFEDIAVKHFADSCLPAMKITLPSPLIDIGTGPGFPGIPLKIIRPNTEIILAEPKHKRVKFLGMVIRELSLEGIEIYPHLVTEKSFFTVNGVITRALESAGATLSRVNHFLPEGGRVILMKGPEADADVSAARESPFSLERDITYEIPGTLNSRRLLVYKKTESTMRKSYIIMKDQNESTGVVITSEDNKRYKEFKKFASGDGLKKSGATIIAGKKIIREAAESGIKISAFAVPDGYTETDQRLASILDNAAAEGKLFILKKGLFGEIDTFNTHSPLAAASVPEILPYNTDEPVSGCVLMLPFQDPANVGAVVRSAAAFGVKSAVCLAGSASPFHPKAVRTSAGAVFSMNFFSGPGIDGLNDFSRSGSIIPLDKRGMPLSEFIFPENFFLLPGIEGPGLPENFIKKSVSIPITDSVESLSAPIAVSIALYEWSRSRKN